MTTKIISRKLKRVILFNKPCKNWKARYRPLFYHIILSFSITWLQSEISKGTSVLQVDFTKNYSTFFQDKIQSAYENKSQISVFTAAIFQCGECLPAKVVSGDLSHSKKSALLFLNTLLNSLLPKDVNILHLLSDGPSIHFKNYFIAKCLPSFESKFNLKVH